VTVEMKHAHEANKNKILGEIRLFLIDDKIEEMICSLNGILFVL
jgi:hypothetical protein